MSASLVIASLALIVSAAALWRTQLAPGQIKATAGVLRLRIYPFDRRGRRWVVPELHVPIAFTNVGARPVIVESVRVSLRYADLGSGDDYEVFKPLLMLRSPLGGGYQSHMQREKRLDEESEWMPTLVPAKETVIRNVVLQGGAWNAPPLGQVKAVLEMKVQDKSWSELEQWSLNLDSEYWHLIYGGMAVAGSRVAHPESANNTTSSNLTETIIARAEEEFGPGWFEELQKRSEERDRRAAEARGEDYDEGWWSQRLK